MKRILYILLILGLNFLNAASLSSTKSVYKVGEDIVIKVKDLEYHPKNWQCRLKCYSMEMDR